MALQPEFFDTPHLEFTEISTANTNRDGTGTILEIFAAASTGSLLERIRATATGTTTAGTIHLFISVDSGANWEFWKDLEIAAVTVTATTAPASAEEVTLDGLLMPDNTFRIGAAPHNAETFNMFAEGSDL